MGSLALLLWYTPHAEGGGPYPPSCAFGMTLGHPPTPSHLVLMPPPPPRAVLVPLLSAPPCLIHAVRDPFSAQVPQPLAGMPRSGLPLRGGFAAQPFCCGHRGSSPSFSHCELSVGVYTRLTYLFIACGKGRVAGKQRGELAAPSLRGGSHGRFLSCLPGSILCFPHSFLAQCRNE